MMIIRLSVSGDDIAKTSQSSEPHSEWSQMAELLHQRAFWPGYIWLLLQKTSSPSEQRNFSTEKKCTFTAIHKEQVTQKHDVTAQDVVSTTSNPETDNVEGNTDAADATAKHEDPEQIPEVTSTLPTLPEVVIQLGDPELLAGESETCMCR